MITKNADIAIKLVNVTKKYVVHHEKPTLMENVLNRTREEFYALKNINITVNRGERVGIIGSNGSGKTTLLKVIAGISSPTKGSVYVSGKIESLIDLEAGFHPDLTGIQNIYLNGTILGMNRREIDTKINDIIEFAGIGKFIDSQLFTYSSGMSLRLGFAVAVHAEPDILVLDENISVGDEKFREISYRKIMDLIKQKKTLITASHDMQFVRYNCSKIYWLDKGMLKEHGSKRVINKYLKS